MLRVKILLQRGGEAVGVHEALKRQRDDGIALLVAQLRRVRLCRAEQKLRRPRFGHAAAVVPVDDRARQKRRAVIHRYAAERDDREQHERERDHERYARFFVSPFFRCRFFHWNRKPLRSVFIL